MCSENNPSSLLSRSVCARQSPVRDIDLYPRYEALIDASKRAGNSSAVLELAGCVSDGWRFCANIPKWRVIVQFDHDVFVVDCDGGKLSTFGATISELSGTDQIFWSNDIPVWLRQVAGDDPRVPDYLRCEHAVDVIVLPLSSKERSIRLLAVLGSAGGEFSAVDRKFASAVAELFMTQLSYLLTTRKLTETLKQQAMQDALTGIPNRRAFDERFDTYWRESAQTGTTLALLLIDVDNFKSFNDQFGHLSGDNCLQMIASALVTAARRPLDFCARIGGEEFAALLPGTSLVGAKKVGTLMLAAVRDLQIEHPGNGNRGIETVSIGVAATAGDLVGSRMTLFQAADRALYKAKRSGRDMLCD